MKNFRSKYFQNLQNNRGVALLMAIFTVILIMYLVMEVSYESNVDYVANSQAVNRLKAYYAAKSGVEISLLRLQIYKKVQKQFGKQLGSQAQMLDTIWNLPFAWPPITPEEMSGVDKEQMQSLSKDSLMDAQYFVTIQDEGSKIDINDLASPAKAIQDSTRRQILNIFENKMQNDEEWARNYRDFRPEELINNITDWIDEDQEARNGGTEPQLYSTLASEGYPPNRAFRTLGEIRMVAGMTEDIFQLLEKYITIYGMKAINPNHASKEILMSIDPQIKPEIAQEIIKRREDTGLGGPYKDANDFWDFVNQQGVRLDKQIEESIPLIFDALYNFRIVSSGQFAKATREITAIVFDIDQSIDQLKAQQKKADAANNPNASPSPSPSPDPNAGIARTNNSGNSSQNSSKGPPQIVYWFEK